MVKGDAHIRGKYSCRMAPATIQITYNKGGGNFTPAPFESYSVFILFNNIVAVIWFYEQ